MKYYDKIFLLLALAVLGASAAYYFNSDSVLENRQKIASRNLNSAPSGEPWKAFNIDELKIESIEWPEIHPQDEEGKWFFQVFTPPQIWVDREGNFITESPYIKESQKKSFALRYKGISNEPYPILYKGYLGSEKEPVIQLEDSRTGQGYYGEINKEIFIVKTSTDGRPSGEQVSVGLKVKSFSKNSIKKEDNTHVDIYTIVLEDKELGKDVTIYSNKPTVISDETRMTFSIDGKDWHVKKAGASIASGDAKYTVKSLDFDAGYAIVEMVPNNKEESPKTMKVSSSGVEEVK